MMDYAVPGVKCVSPRLPLPVDARYRILGAAEVLAKLGVLAQPVPSRGPHVLPLLPANDDSTTVDDGLLDDELEHPPVLVLASPPIQTQEARKMEGAEDAARASNRFSRLPVISVIDETKLRADGLVLLAYARLHVGEWQLRIFRTITATILRSSGV